MTTPTRRPAPATPSKRPSKSRSQAIVSLLSSPFIDATLPLSPCCATIVSFPEAQFSKLTSEKREGPESTDAPAVPNFVSGAPSEVRRKGPKIWPPGRCAEPRKCPTFLLEGGKRVEKGGPHSRKLMRFGLRASESYAAIALKTGAIHAPRSCPDNLSSAFVGGSRCVRCPGQWNLYRRGQQRQPPRIYHTGEDVLGGYCGGGHYEERATWRDFGAQRWQGCLRTYSS